MFIGRVRPDGRSVGVWRSESPARAAVSGTEGPFSSPRSGAGSGPYYRGVVSDYSKKKKNPRIRRTSNEET